jgi:hypothetical protein
MSATGGYFGSPYFGSPYFASGFFQGTTMPGTYADLKGEVDAGTALVSSDEAQIAQLQAKIATDQHQLAAANAAWVEAVTANKGIVEPNADGGFTVYTPDGNGGVTSNVYPSVSAPLPASPTG